MRILFWLFALIAAGVILASCTSGNAQQVTRQISGDEVFLLSPGTFESKLAETPGAQLVDVREAEEVENGYISGALNIDYHAQDFEEQLEKQLDKSTSVFVYCMGGGRSAKAALALRELGFSKVYELEGGFSAWKSAGKPIVK